MTHGSKCLCYDCYQHRILNTSAEVFLKGPRRKVKDAYLEESLRRLRELGYECWTGQAMIDQLNSELSPVEDFSSGKTEAKEPAGD